MFLRKLEDGRELRGYDMMDCEVKVLNDNEIEMIGSTNAVDRDGDIIDQDGWDLKNYKKNPVVLPAHNYRDPAIASSLVSKKDGNLVFKITFPEEGVNPMSDIYRKLYKGGFMRASSVGFIPREWSDSKDKSGTFVRTFTKAELLELSLVTVPSNPEALISQGKSIDEAKDKGVINEDEASTVKSYIKLIESKKEEKPEEKPGEEIPVKEYMTKEDVEKLIDEKIEEKIQKQPEHYSQVLLESEVTPEKEITTPVPTKEQLASIVKDAVKEHFKTKKE